MKNNHFIKVSCKLTNDQSRTCHEVITEGCVIRFKQKDKEFYCYSFNVDWTTYLTNQKYLTFLKDNWDDDTNS